MKSDEGELDLLQDVGGFGGPDEGFGVVVVMVDVVEDRCDQLLDTVKDSAAQPIFGQVAEEAFYHMQTKTLPSTEMRLW